MGRRRNIRGNWGPGGLAERPEPVAPTAEELRPINLKKRFPQYRVGYEDPAFVGHEDPWHFIVICQHGHIAPAGGDLLWACTNRPRSRKLPAEPRRAPDRLYAAAQEENSLVVKQDGDDGLSIEFDVSDFGLVAAFLKPKGR